MRALVTGWFSFERMGATAGDLLVRDAVVGWLTAAGVPTHVANAPPFPGGVDWRAVDPGDYTHLLFACGPFGRSRQVEELLDRFSHCRLVGLNLSMLDPLAEWNPFDLLLERDSSRTARPDLSFASGRPAPPVAGLVLVHPQAEYGHRGMHAEAEAMLRGALQGLGAAVIEIDTRLDENRTGLREPGQVEALIGRTDVVATTRLHGMVLALKHGIPALAVDPIRGGAKITRQASALGWPFAFRAEDVDEHALGHALVLCLGSEARDRALACRNQALRAVDAVRIRLLAFLGQENGEPDGEPAGQRQACASGE